MIHFDPAICECGKGIRGSIDTVVAVMVRNADGGYEWDKTDLETQMGQYQTAPDGRDQMLVCCEDGHDFYSSYEEVE